MRLTQIWWGGRLFHCNVYNKYTTVSEFYTNKNCCCYCSLRIYCSDHRKQLIMYLGLLNKGFITIDHKNFLKNFRTYEFQHSTSFAKETVVLLISWLGLTQSSCHCDPGAIILPLYSGFEHLTWRWPYERHSISMHNLSLPLSPSWISLACYHSLETASEYDQVSH